jgi:hypothetical protein
MMAIAPDAYYIAGKDDHTKDMAKLFMENLLFHVEEFAAIEIDGKLTTMWANLKTW